MQKLLAQMTLGFSSKNEATFANFYSAQNAEVIAQLKRMAEGYGEQIFYLCGMRGQGRSHLLQAICHHAHQHQLRSIYLPFTELLHHTPDILNGFDTLPIVCLDDVHLIAGKKDWEEAVFCLFNNIYDAGGKVIVTANDLPKSIHITLPDLVSRLSWGGVYQLTPLEDKEKIAVLIMRAKERGITLSDEVGKYILTHCPRHMGTLFAALNALDKASLAAQRRLTIPFVKEVLQI